MNPADLAIVVIMLLSIAIGIWRGFIAEVFALVAWALAILGASLFGPTVGELFATRIELPSVRLALGCALVFVAVLVLGALVTWALRELVEETGLSGTDRMLGLVFGVVRGMIIVVLLVLLAGLTPLPRDSWWRGSVALPTFQACAEAVLPWLPQALSRQVNWDAAPAPKSIPSAAAPARAS